MSDVEKVMGLVSRYADYIYGNDLWTDDERREAYDSLKAGVEALVAERDAFAQCAKTAEE